MNIQDLYVPLPAKVADAPRSGVAAANSKSPAPTVSTGPVNGSVADRHGAAVAAGDIEYASWFTSPGASR